MSDVNALAHMPEPWWMLATAGIVALVPLVIGVSTAYLKISIVLGLLRSGLGAPQVPSGLVIMALSLSLSFYVMAPVFEASLHAADRVFASTDASHADLSILTEIEPIAAPWKEFMHTHAGKREVQALRSFETLEQAHAASSAADTTHREHTSSSDAGAVSWRILLPAFALSELKEAFVMGFMLLLPFLVIDLVVANLLVGMGMFMVSPVMVSLPIKLILFVLADGWLLVARGLISSY